MPNFTDERQKIHIPSLPALPSGARSAAVAWQLLAALAGALLAGGQVYGGAAPFGLALVLGCPRGHLLAAAAGVLAGGLLMQPVDLAVKLAGAVAAATAVRRLLPDRFTHAALAGGGVLLAEEFIALVVAGGVVSPAATLRVAGTAALACGFGWALRILPAGQPRSFCLWLVMAAACLQRFAAGGFAPGLFAAAAVGLCAAYAGSLEQTAVLCVALTAALAAATPSQCFAALAAALGSLGAALLCPGERLRCAGVFVCGCVLGGLAAPDTAGLLALLFSAAAALAVFLVLPDEALRQVFPPPAPPAAAQGLSGAARRLAGVADTLSDIADTVNAVCERQSPPRGETFDFVVEHTARVVCQKCPRRSQCWVRGYTSVMDALYHLRAALEARGQIQVEDLQGQLSGCIHPADLCGAVNHGYRLWRSRRQSRARLSTLRAALTEQYTALAAALAQLADKLGQAGLPDPRREARVSQLFSGIGLEALECSVTSDLSGRITADVTVARTRFTDEELAALAGEVSRLCRRDLDLPEVTACRTVTMLRFCEKPLFGVEFGAASRPAGGQEISGDALEQFRDHSGRAQMLLCDGMGTGRPAAVDGRMAARLTSQLLRAGFAAESAARLVNVALGLKGTEQEAGATLDLLTVDLYTGRAGLFKAGAAPSFVVKRGVPRMLDGASLPIGVVDSLVGKSTALTLDAGDWVVLVSDGALADGTGWLMEQLQLCVRLDHTPEQAANVIADAAVRRAGQRRDDITVAILALQNAQTAAVFGC